MAEPRYSPKAEADLVEIADYTIRTWGDEQADKYLGELDDTCELLATNPNLGRSCEDLRKGLRKFHQGSHWIFYQPSKGGIWISRILHMKRNPTRKHFQ